MPVYLVLLIAVAVAVARARSWIEQVEGPHGSPAVAPSRHERWQAAPGSEKAAFVILALSAAVWLLLILPMGFAAAAVALGAAVWKRPYLEATLAPTVLIGGAVIVVYDLLVPLLRDEGDWGCRCHQHELVRRALDRGGCPAGRRRKIPRRFE